MQRMLSTLLFVGCFLLGMGRLSEATTLTANISMDNGYQIFLATEEAVVGDLFGAHNNWYTTYTDTATLLAGTNYFLHVYGYDQGGIAGFLGQFSLSGTDHRFANDLTTLLTNTVDWSGNNTGWGDVMGSLTALGTNGVSPWGTRPGIDAAATWIWAGDANANNAAYFSTVIYATAAAPVPEPGTFLLVGGGLLGLAFCRRRK